MNTRPIVVVGSLNLDLVVHAHRIPSSGETLMGTGYDESLGGKGANQAVAAAKLGCAVTMIGRTGNDAYGERLRAGMQQAGVDLSASATPALRLSAKLFSVARPTRFQFSSL